MKINIMGSEWEIKHLTAEEYPAFKSDIEYEGFSDYTSKTIYLRKYQAPELKPTDVDDLKKNILRNLKHEIVHSMFAECGLNQSQWDCDEMLVDWIAQKLEDLVGVYNNAKEILNE